MSQLALIDVPPVIEPEPDEKYTPTAFFRPLHDEFNFTVDVCATAESAKVPRFYSAADNGLRQSWAGERVWCNPPYSDIEPWVRKAEFETFRGCELVAMLLPSWTDREWWHEFIEPFRDRKRPSDLVGPAPRIETRFIRPRIVFGRPGDPEGLRSPRSPDFWNALVIWGRP